MAIAIETLADDMYQMVAETHGQEEPQGRRPHQGHDREARRGQLHARTTASRRSGSLIDSERCVYSYFGGSYITLPHKEGAAPD